MWLGKCPSCRGIADEPACLSLILRFFVYQMGLFILMSQGAKQTRWHNLRALLSGTLLQVCCNISPLQGEGSIPCPRGCLPGEIPKRVQTPDFGSQALPPPRPPCHPHCQVTYWIFFVKFLETMPPSCCFSSCLPGRERNATCQHLSPFGHPLLRTRAWIQLLDPPRPRCVPCGLI